MIRSVKALSTALIVSAAFMTSTVLAQSTSAFAPSNPFYATSTLPFHAPPFDKIKDSDYQPAIEAGMAQQLEEIRAIADNPAPPTFENTLVAMEKTGALFRRATAAFDGVTGANTNPTLQKAEEALAPLIAAHSDAIYLNSRLFARVQAVYNQRESLKLDPESQRLLEIVYQRFVHAGANLSDADKAKLKKLNEEESTLSNAFKNKLLAATRDAALRHHRQGRTRRPERRPDCLRRAGRQDPRPAGLRDSAAEHHAAAFAHLTQRSRHAANAL